MAVCLLFQTGLYPGRTSDLSPGVGCKPAKFPRFSRSRGSFTGTDFLMEYRMHDVHAGAGINKLLDEALRIVAEALSADLVLVMEHGAIDRQSDYCSSTGRDQTTAMRLGRQLLDQVLQDADEDPETLTSSRDLTPGRVCRPSREFLQAHDLHAGLYTAVSCGQGTVMVFAGYAQAAEHAGQSDARFLHALTSMLGLAVTSASAELERSASQQIHQGRILLEYNKELENKLRCSGHELDLLSKRLMLAQEAERKRIAMELHDGIGQSLSAIKFGVENALLESSERTSQQNSECLKDIVDKLRNAIKEVRSISMGLRPSILDDLGLLATIGWFCREFRSLHPAIRIATHIKADDGDIPDVLGIVVFRILQEALNNIGRHADASNVSVEFSRSGDSLKLRIEDDGRGIPAEACRVAGGMGLGSMKERVKLSCGILTIDTGHGTGTILQATWPLTKRVDDKSDC